MRINAQHLTPCVLALFLFFKGAAAQSAFDWSTSPNSWSNSPYNPVNSPYAPRNSPYALENSPNNANPSNGVFDGDGNRVGFYVPNNQGSTNVFDLDGSREFYTPYPIAFSPDVGPYNPNQASNSPYALENSPYALENSPYTPNKNNGVFNPDGERVGYISPISRQFFITEPIPFIMPKR